MHYWPGKPTRRYRDPVLVAAQPMKGGLYLAETGVFRTSQV